MRLELQELGQIDTETLGDFLQRVDLRVEPRTLGFEALDALVVEVGGFRKLLLREAAFGSKRSDSVGNPPANVLRHTAEYGKQAAWLTPQACPIYTIP